MWAKPQERIVYEVKDKEMTATATGFAPEVSTSNAGMASNAELLNMQLSELSPGCSLCSSSKCWSHVLLRRLRSDFPRSGYGQSPSRAEFAVDVGVCLWQCRLRPLQWFWRSKLAMASLHEPEDPRGIKSHGQDEKFGSSQFNFKNLFISFHIYCGLRLHPLFQKLWKFSRWGQSGRLAVACKS